MVAEVLDRYLDLTSQIGVYMAAGFAGVLVLAAMWHKVGKRVVSTAVVTRWGTRISLGLLWGAIAGGLVYAVSRASVVDDAFISFRYAEHLANGDGLVFNVGERVEGYTNFLWTVLIALLYRLTGLDMPFVSLMLCLSAFVGALVITFRIGRRLHGQTGGTIYFPAAVLLLACSRSFTEFATTGLETMAAALMVTLMGLILIRKTMRYQALALGGAGIVATLIRPDMSIFYVMGGVTLLLVRLPALFFRGGALRERWRRFWPSMVQYAIPFVPYVLYLAWKLQYYGDILPNTYLAKTAGEAHFDNGLLYMATFFLGHHFWLVGVIWAAWFALKARGEGEGALKVFSLLSITAYLLYVVEVGGDFMVGRFYVPIMPLMLLGAERTCLILLEKNKESRSAWKAALLAVPLAMLLITAHGVRIIGPKNILWGIANEGAIYKVGQLYPVVIEHANYVLGKTLNRCTADHDDPPVIATSGIGMVGFYSKLETIDIVGLTDRTLALAPQKSQVRVGHALKASMAYLRERDVLFARTLMYKPKWFREKTRIHFGPGTGSKPWYLAYYDHERMTAFKETCPKMGFFDYTELVDKYIRELDGRDRRQVRQDLRWLRRFYFDHNDALSQLRKIQDYINQ